MNWGVPATSRRRRRLGGGAQVVVDAHEAALGQFHTRGLQAETGGDRGPSQGNEQVGASRLAPVGGGDDDAAPVGRSGDLRGVSTSQDRDAQGLQAGGHLGGDVVVLPIQNVLSGMDDGDRHAEEPMREAISTPMTPPPRTTRPVGNSGRVSRSSLVQ